MTLEQLRIFAAVAERGHMTQAAAALGLTQSAVSAAVAALEARHGVKLFDRVGRGLALTEAGSVFLEEARQVLAAAARATQALDDLAGLTRGSLTLAASQTVASYWLPGRLARFSLAHPGVKVVLEVGNTRQVAAAVAAGQADLGLIEGDIDDDRLGRRRVAEDRVGLFCRIDHPLAWREAGAAALADARWVLRESGSGTRAAFERAVADLGLRVADLRVVLEAPSNEACLAAAEGAGLLTAVSDLAAGPLRAAGRIAPLANDLGQRGFELIHHRERRLSAAARAFAEGL